ncbi:hypothetical protein KSS87_012895 [Heliosperma pusillum]|nr:hypothetical protein KSS87_012895 [Heliosperma pusillum]
MKSSLDKLRGFPRTHGFVTFDSTIHLYNTKSSGILLYSIHSGSNERDIRCQ